MLYLFLIFSTLKLVKVKFPYWALCANICPVLLIHPKIINLTISHGGWANDNVIVRWLVPCIY